MTSSEQRLSLLEFLYRKPGMTLLEVPEAKRSGRFRGELADDVVTQRKCYSFRAAGNT